MSTKFKPHISANAHVREFTLPAILLGTLLGLIFGVGNAYLGLKVGTTVSASIPAAVISMAILRTFFKRTTILENNLVQTIASVGEGIAAGVIFTVPALFLLGEPPSIWNVFLLSALGGILGVLFMIPMRRFIIVEEHKKLPFPEGTACAEILKSGEAGRHKAVFALVGIITGSLYRLCSSAFYLWKEIPSWIFPRFERASFSIDCTPALLGVGFIIGPRIASLLFFGGILGWWVLIPLIAQFGTGTGAIFPGTIPIAQMSADDIWSNYIRYIGAGAVGIGGLISLFKIAPMIKRTLTAGMGELFSHAKRRQLARTDHDISLRWLVLGSAAIILFLWLYPGFPMNLLTIILLVILGFFFAGVTSLTVGIVGSTSNPVSGMTITVLLITCIIFLALGWTERIYLTAAITMSIVVNVTIALASTTSQDLKTGFLLGATPRWQQIGEIIGVFIPALTMGGTLYLLNAAYTFGSPQMPAPQGMLIALITKGVMEGNIPIVLVLLGVILGLLVAMLRLPVLPFAIGLYLPLSLSTGIMVGGMIALFMHQRKEQPITMERGVLLASGLVAGDACTGVVIAFLTVIGTISGQVAVLTPQWVSLVCYALLGLGLWRVSRHPPLFLNK